MERREELTRLIARTRRFIEDGTGDCFETLALEVFRFQREFNLPYRRFCANAAVNDWRDIPAIVTSAFKEADWTALTPEEGTRVFHSSGTTGANRSRHFHSRETLALYEASLLPWFKGNVAGCAQMAEFISLTPPPELAPNSSLVHMFKTVSRVFGKRTCYGLVDQEGAWTLDFEKLCSRRCKEADSSASDPVVLCGAAFSFMHLCDWARDQGVKMDLPAGSRVVETGGYKGRSRVVSKEELHVMISEVCGVPRENIITEYGMSELSSQAYDTGPGRLFRFPHWARARIISPETGGDAAEGEPGLIRVYDLANVGSVIAVQTEDLGVRRGDGFELLGRAALSEARGCSLMPAA